MAALSATDRQRVWRGVQRYWSEIAESCGVTKSDLQAAVNAVDDWVDLNAAAYNLAIPQPARNNLTAGQKTLLLCAVALVRKDPALAAKLFKVD